MEIEEHLEHCYLRASSTNSVKESTSKADRSRVTFNITVILMRSAECRVQTLEVFYIGSDSAVMEVV